MCQSIGENFKLKLASNMNPPIDEEEINRIHSIKLPLTIQHPFHTSKKVYKGLVSILGVGGQFEVSTNGGHGPEEE